MTHFVFPPSEKFAHGHGITVAAAADTAEILTVTTYSRRAAATSTVRTQFFSKRPLLFQRLKRDNSPSVEAGAILAQEASILILFALSLVKEVGQETRLFG